MLTSFYTALTGLDMNALAINVIGNNLANINTTAFKTSRPSFAELIGGLGNVTAGDGNPVQIGLGATSPGVSPIFTQGSIQYTGRSTDVGINGNGFFLVAIRRTRSLSKNRREAFLHLFEFLQRTPA